MAKPVRPQDSLVKFSPPAFLAKKETNRVVKVADGKGVPSTEELLNKMIPVKHFHQDAREWAQSISSDPATRLDVIGLQVCSIATTEDGTCVALKQSAA